MGKQRKARGGGERIRGLASGADTVRTAADVLQGEIATGIAAGRRVTARVRSERRVDPADLQEALTRFREDGRAAVDLARDLTAQLRSDTTNDLALRLFNDANDALELVFGMIETAPDLINRISQMAETAAPPAATKKPRTAKVPSAKQQ